MSKLSNILKHIYVGSILIWPLSWAIMFMFKERNKKQKGLMIAIYISFGLCLLHGLSFGLIRSKKKRKK